MFLGLGFLASSDSSSPTPRRSGRSPRRAQQQERRAMRLRRSLSRPCPTGHEEAYLFLREALERHDQVVAQLSKHALTTEPTLSFREHVLTTLEEHHARLGTRAPISLLPGLPSTVEEEKRRQAMVAAVGRQLAQERRERQELLDCIDEVLESFREV